MGSPSKNGNVKKKPLDFVNRALTSVDWLARPFRARQPEDLLRAARIHFAEDFPNAEREDCPARRTLSAIVESQELPSPDVREHLLMCSECFAYYRKALAHRHAARLSEFREGRSAIRTRTLVPILAGSLATILVATLVFVIVHYRSENLGGTANVNGTSMKDPPPRSADDPNTRLATPEQTPHIALQPGPQTPVDPNKARSLVVQNRVSVDFEAYNLLRSAGSSRLPSLRLRRTQNQLTIKLPAASPQGRYRISLTDPYGGTLQSVETVSRNGTQLRLKLNLSSVKPGAYLLCLERESEVPQCIPSVLRKK